SVVSGCVWGGRPLSILIRKARLPSFVSRAVPVFLLELADHKARRVSSWLAAGTVLPPLLLGRRSADSGCRHDERDLGGSPRCAVARRTARHGRVVDPRHRRRFDRFWGVSGN